MKLRFFLISIFTHFLILLIIVLSSKITLELSNNDAIDVDIVAKIIRENNTNSEFEKKSNNTTKYDKKIMSLKDSKKLSESNKKHKNDNIIRNIYGNYTVEKKKKLDNENTEFKKILSTQKSTFSQTNSNDYFRKAFYRIGSKYNPHPPYPIIARKKGWEGHLILKVFVNHKGSAEKVEVIKSSGYKILDEVSLNTVKNWIFIPARQGIVDIEDQIQVPIRFILNS